MPMPPQEAVECMTIIAEIQAEIDGYEDTICEAMDTAKIARKSLREARARLGRYIANSTRELPLFDKPAESIDVDVDAELTAGVAEAEAARAAKLAADPDFQRGDAEGEAWHKARHADDWRSLPLSDLRGYGMGAARAEGVCPVCKGTPKTMCPACGKTAPTPPGPEKKPRRRRKPAGPAEARS